MPELAGSIDLDLSATAVTNTLPIRHLWLAPAEQRYTQSAEDSRYRYESLTTGFTADLAIDGPGLVTGYSGLFERAV